MAKAFKIICGVTLSALFAYGVFKVVYLILSEKKALIYPDGRRAEYGYDDLMRLIRLDVKEAGRSTEQQTGNGVISGRTEGATLASILYTYDTEGRLKEKKYRDGLRTVWHYNDDGLPEELIHEDKEGILDKYTYSYDAMGNKTGIIKVRRGLNEESGSYSYGYDELNRLTGVSKDGELIREYSFDAFSNRSVLTDHGRGTRTIYHYNALNQLTDEHTEAIASADKEIEAAVGFNRIPGIKRDVPNNAGYTIDKVYKYDKRGNLIREMRGEALIHGYEYGAINRLTRSWNDHDEEAGYIYNGLGHRVGRETAKSDLKGTSNIFKQTYLIDMLRPYHNLLNLTDRSGNRTQDFIYDGNVAGSIGGACDPVHFYMQDELGSPIRVSTGADSIDNEVRLTKEERYLTYGYDEYGNGMYEDTDETFIQPFGYTGYRYDETAGTYFAQAREYRPEDGRFGGVDWIKGNTAEPITQNSYVYCDNTPNVFVDSNGMTSIPTFNVETYDSGGNLLYEQTIDIETGISIEIEHKQYTNVYALYESKGAYYQGHAATLLISNDGSGEFYSWAASPREWANIMVGNDVEGYMSYESMTAEEVQAFLYSG